MLGAALRRAAQAAPGSAIRPQAGHAGRVGARRAWRHGRDCASSKVEFQGVTFDAKDPLPGQLPQQAGEPLDPAKVTASIRQAVRERAGIATSAWRAGARAVG